MCSLLNHGFVSVIDTCVFCIVFVLLGKTVLLYCYANKSLESLRSMQIPNTSHGYLTPVAPFTNMV